MAKKGTATRQESELKPDRLTYLQSLRTTQLQGYALAQLSPEAQRNRLDCLIYFAVVEFGYGYRRTPDGKRDFNHSAVSHMRRLGYPSRGRLQNAAAKIRKLCPVETQAYETAFRRFKEARRRYLATQTKEAWEWYLCGKGNSMSVAIRTHIERRRRNASHRFNQGYFRYRQHELLSRQGERKRARRQIDEEQAQMSELRRQIFVKMKVPAFARNLA